MRSLIRSGGGGTNLAVAIVLVQLGTDGAGENGGRFTVKKYHSEKTVTADGWRHTSLQLLPVNPAFEPIEIEAGVAADVVIVGEHILIIPDAGFAR